MEHIRLKDTEDGKLLSEYSEEQQRQILEYLLTPDFHYMAAGPSEYIDAKTGVVAGTTIFFAYDGKYDWLDEDFFLIRDERMRLDNAFAEHVLGFYADGGSVKVVNNVYHFGRIPNIPTTCRQRKLTSGW